MDTFQEQGTWVDREFEFEYWVFEEGFRDGLKFDQLKQARQEKKTINARHGTKAWILQKRVESTVITTIQAIS